MSESNEPVHRATKKMLLGVSGAAGQPLSEETVDACVYALVSAELLLDKKNMNKVQAGGLKAVAAVFNDDDPRIEEAIRVGRSKYVYRTLVAIAEGIESKE